MFPFEVIDVYLGIRWTMTDCLLYYWRRKFLAVIVVVCFAVVANIVEFLFSSDSGGCSWEWSSLGTDCSKSGKIHPSYFKIQPFKGGSPDLKVLGN